MSSTTSFWDELRDPEFAHAFFDEFLNTKIATQINVIREQRQLTQKELAARATMAQERICLLENVNYSSWSVNTLRRIAKALGVRLNVSFEPFSAGIKEVQNFKRPALECKSLAEEIEELDVRAKEAVVFANTLGSRGSAMKAESGIGANISITITTLGDMPAGQSPPDEAKLAPWQTMGNRSVQSGYMGQRT